MRFKVIGVVLLLAAVYLLGYGYFEAKTLNNPAIEVQFYPLTAIFLALVVRIFQAEKHHRNELQSSQADEPEEVEENEVEEDQ